MESTGQVGGDWRPPLRIIASGRRRRTVAARVRDGTLEVLVPRSMGRQERLEWAERMRARLERRQRGPPPGDADLERRARCLNQTLFEGRLRWISIAFADQKLRWGSCSSGTGEIRIARRAAGLPAWVLDYLLVHELAHLEEPDHGPGFWSLVSAYPLAERARGYLMGLDHARSGAGTEPPG